MKMKFPRTKLTLLIGAIALTVGGVIAYAAVYTGSSDHIGLWQGPATIVANDNNVTGAGVTGGWHYHPGYMYNVVKQGTVVVEDGCAQPGDPNPEDFGTRTYTSGQAFEKADGRVHRAVNPDGGLDEIEVSMTILPPGVPARVPSSGSLGKHCGPARSVDECKRYWERFDFPYTFNNQGECIAFVNNRRRVSVLAPDYYPDFH
jgi:hypothetical protein